MAGLKPPGTALATAEWAIEQGLWPVAVTAYDAKGASPGKRPIGQRWGMDRPTPESTRATYRRHPKAGVGLKLGAEGGVVDFDIDQPEHVGPTIERLFPGGIPPTLRWSNASGRFHAIFRYDERLSAIGKSIIKGVVKPGGEISGNANYLGLEVRIGAAPGEDKQLQSVIPPSLLPNGASRRWVEWGDLLTLPESVVLDLQRLAVEATAKPVVAPPRARSGSERWTPEARALAYLERCDPAVSGQRGHDQALKTAVKVGPGFDLDRETAFRLLRDYWNPTCDPPWSERELWHKVDQSYQVEAKRGWLLRETPARPSSPATIRIDRQRPDKQAVRHYNLTDLGNAERLVHRHGKSLRYCHPWKRWMGWDGRRWALDNTASARRLARETVRSIYSEASSEDGEDLRKAIAKWGMESEKRDRISAMLSLAEAEESIPILPEYMDRDPWSFNVLNGTIDLRTGLLRPHRREDLITKLCPIVYEPEATAPLWDGTLRKFFADDQGLIDYFQAIAGYAITGIVRDHIMPVAYGKGANGKSTMLGTLMDVFGPDYAMKCPPDMLMAKKTDSHPTDRADLFGKRLVVAIETEAGRRLNETMVKELTGGDKIRARRMREDFWEFEPTHTLILATNHKPRVRGNDDGIWRRLKLIPFGVRAIGKDAVKEMPERLKAEFSGILTWCIQGCLKWQKDGMVEPSAVVSASSEYRKEMDVIGRFLEDCCALDPRFKVRAGEVYARYKSWCETTREFAVTQAAFGTEMEDRDIEKKESHGIWYRGLMIRETATNKEDSSSGIDESRHPF